MPKSLVDYSQQVKRRIQCGVCLLMQDVQAELLAGFQRNVPVSVMRRWLQEERQIVPPGESSFYRHFRNGHTEET